jgi:hypothetical protein
MGGHANRKVMANCNILFAQKSPIWIGFSSGRRARFQYDLARGNSPSALIFL